MGVITPSCMLLCSTLGSRLILKETADGGPHRGRARDHGRARRARLGRPRESRRAHVARRRDVRRSAACSGRATRSARACGASSRCTRRPSSACCRWCSTCRATRGLRARISRPRRGARSSIQAVFQGVLSAIVALLFYTRAVAILGAARGAVFAALVPTFSLLLAIPLLARDADDATARRRRVRDGRHGVRAGPARPREMAVAAYSGSAAMKSTMRLRSAASGKRPRAAVMLSTM